MAKRITESSLTGKWKQRLSEYRWFCIEREGIKSYSEATRRALARIRIEMKEEAARAESKVNSQNNLW